MIDEKDVWLAVESFLPKGTRLSSGYRSPQKQLEILISLATKRGYRFSEKPTVEDKSSWKAALDFVRSKGVKIAEPGRSPHERGVAFDFTGAPLLKIKAGLLKAKEAGVIKLAKTAVQNPLIEHENNCVHVELDSVSLVMGYIWKTAISVSAYA